MNINAMFSSACVVVVVLAFFTLMFSLVTEMETTRRHRASVLQACYEVNAERPAVETQVLCNKLGG